MSDDLARWWPNWHEIIHNNDSTPGFCDRMLFTPHRIPQSDTYELWSDIIFFCNQDCYLLGPFVFESYSDIIKPNKHVSTIIWESLF